MTMHKAIAFGFVVALVLSPGAPMWPAEEEQKDKDNVTGEAEVGVAGQDQEPEHSAKFSEFRDVPNGFTAERLFLTWSPKEGFFFDLRAQDVSQLDQRIGVAFGGRDLWKGSITWAENPRLWTDQAKQLYARQPGSVFTLDDTLQSAIQAAPASVDTTPADGQWDAGTKGAILKSAINSSAQDASVGWQRSTGRVGFEVTPSRHWTFNAGAQRERRGGTIPQTLGMYFALSPSEVAAPLDFRTDVETVGAEYDHARFNLGVQLTGSQFSTGYDSVTWDDQLFLNDTAVNATTANPARGRLTFATDNKLAQGTVYGGVSLPAHTRIDAVVSRTETTQDDPFLPMTTNTLLAPAPLPAASYDGKYDIDLASVRVSSRPTKTLRWSAWFRDWKYDNKSSELTFADYVTTDYQIPLCGNANECGATTNHISRKSLPYGWERTNMGGSIGVRPTTWFDGSVALEREDIQREHSAVTDGHEDTLKVGLDFDVAAWLSIRTTARRQERRADDYDAEYFLESFPIGEQNVAASNEGMRRFIWTDRDRDQFSVLLDFSVGKSWSIYAESTYIRDLYFDPLTGKRVGESYDIQEDRNFDTVLETYNILLAGRTDDKYLTHTIGFGVNPGPRYSIYADYTWEHSTYGLETRFRTVTGGIGTDDPLDNWGSDTDDKYKTATIGFTLNPGDNGRWKASADASRSEGTSHIENHFVPGGNASSDTTLLEFPLLKTTLTIVHASLTRAMRKDLDVSFRYWYEKWHEDNFASDFSQPYMGDPGNDPGSVTAIFLGLDFANYTNHLLGFFMNYRF
jgi:MtrB/PioB family decaheme-associated outer membrane protein